MKNYEKKSFIQIFLGYFVSVAMFILLLGYLYFQQQQTFLMQKIAMNMHQYLMKLKQSQFKYKQDGFSYEATFNSKLKKQLPQKDGDIYYKAFSKRHIIKIDASIVDNELKKIKYFTIILQILLISFFAFISFILARKSLKPMADTISHLDRFMKDLIHDLNTPITSILINSKMLKKDAIEKDIKKITRIENSAKNISSLYANLEILLDGNSLKKENIDLTILINDIVEIYKSIYPNIKFNVDIKGDNVNINLNAIKRILDNIISNACKYSIDINPTIEISYNNDILIIKDNGKGIKYPKKIFERSYKEVDSGHGIGMHIVHRLCSELSISIDIKSEPNQGTIVTLKFN
ncbi:MAG: HAMP domain-containing histidine kinase [Arcobacteraceae bacterium]|nr:HAMP domain-containing histidine kinase [Arcobacteraceae bacterium]